MRVGKGLSLFVTGIMGAGKSTVCESLGRLAAHAGIPLTTIDIDTVRCNLLTGDSRGSRRFQSEVARRFRVAGSRESSGIDRLALSTMLFEDRAARREFDCLVAPYYAVAIAARTGRAEGIVLVEWALAAEQNLLPLTSYNAVVVCAPVAAVIARSRGGDLPDWQIEARLASQHSTSRKIEAVRRAQREAGRGVLFLVENGGAWREETVEELFRGIVSGGGTQ